MHKLRRLHPSSVYKRGPERFEPYEKLLPLNCKQEPGRNYKVQTSIWIIKRKAKRVGSETPVTGEHYKIIISDIERKDTVTLKLNSTNAEAQ